MAARDRLIPMSERKSVFPKYVPDVEPAPTITIKSLYNEAIKTNCWIVEGNFWYTPEEFKLKTERITRGLDLTRFDLKNPINRITDGFKYIVEFKEYQYLPDLEKFIIRVIEYYQTNR